MLLGRNECVAILRCPVTREHLTFAPDGSSRAEPSGRSYLSLEDTPILIDFENSVIDRNSFIGSHGASSVKRRRYVRLSGGIKKLLSPPKKATRVNVDWLVKELETRPDARVLIIGGGTVGQGMEPLYDHSSIKVISFDIYRTDRTQFIADAHAIPLADGSVDAVVVQAVLEHVVHPETVAAEIWRVLKDGGLLYAETPFMQHVHEGAYDFTRFTESGHRFLFRRFQLIRSGTTAGPGTQLLWAVDYFVKSLFRSRIAGKIAKAAFVWLQWFDGLISEDYSSDAASGVYFLGRKSDIEISPREVVDFYRGAQKGG
jgi:ubiquinone/menaquinone biosynthesis C-methylase UbiE